MIVNLINQVYFPQMYTGFLYFYAFYHKQNNIKFFAKPLNI